jgi:hypothetical protein
VESNGQTFFGCAEDEAAARALLARLDAARRCHIVGDDGTALLKASGQTVVVSAGEPGRKVFTWGVGSMLGNGNPSAQAWGLPQRVAAFRAS